MLYAAEVVLLSLSSLWCVRWMLRAADRQWFPSTYVTMRAPEVLVLEDDYTPHDWRGLI